MIARYRSGVLSKHTVDELTDKIVSVLGGGDQVCVQVLCVE